MRPDCLFFVLWLFGSPVATVDTERVRAQEMEVQHHAFRITNMVVGVLECVRVLSSEFKFTSRSNVER